MIEDWLVIGDQEHSGVRSTDVHDQDFESCSGDEGSLGFDPPDLFIGWLGYSREHGGVEFGAMNISVMDLQDPQEIAPLGSPAPNRVSQEIPTTQPRQSAEISHKLRRQRYSRIKDMTCARYGAKSCVTGPEALRGYRAPPAPTQHV